jgi:hypothetical protein
MLVAAAAARQATHDMGRLQYEATMTTAATHSSTQKPALMNRAVRQRNNNE